MVKPPRSERGVWEFESLPRRMKRMVEIWRDIKSLNLKDKYYWIRGLLRYKHSCKGKVKYSKKSALKAKRAMENKTGRTFDVYMCLWCGKYHIGGSIKEIRND